MRRLLRNVGIMFLSAILLGTLSCKNDVTEIIKTLDVTLADIKVEKAKVKYDAGEKLEATVFAIYTDGNTKEVTDSGNLKCKVAGKDFDRGKSLEVSDSGEIAFVYTEEKIEKTCKLNITVGEVTLTDLDIYELSSQMEGSAFDKERVLVFAVYSNGEYKRLLKDEFEVKDVLEVLKAGSAAPIFSYKGKEKQKTINIDPKPEEVVEEDPPPPVVLEDLRVAGLKTYKEGEPLDISQTIVLAKYSDGTLKDVTADTKNNAPITFDVVGSKTVEFTYEEGEITKKCAVLIRVNEKPSEEPDEEEPEIVPPPTLIGIEAFGPTLYLEGESLNKDQTIILALYSDDTLRKITNAVAVAPEKFDTETTEVKFTYEENGVTEYCSLAIKVDKDEEKPFEPEGEPVDNRDLIKWGIGYGFNVIEDEYFDTAKKSTQSIINPEKLTKKYVLKVKNSNNTNVGEISNSNITDYTKNYSNSLNIPDISIKGGYKVFTANVGVSFKNIDEGKFFQNSNQLFYTHYDYRTPYYVQVYNISAKKFRDILSDEFKNDITGQTNATKDKTPEEVAEILYEKYGTHLITGVYLGGKYEYSYAFSSNSMEDIQKLQKGVGVKFGIDVGIKLANVGANVEVETNKEMEEILKSDRVEKSFNGVIYGGASNVGGWSETDMKETYKNWLASFDGKDNETYESNWVTVGATNSGLIGLWELVEDSKLSQALADLYNRKAQTKYNEIVDKYKPKEWEIIVPPVEKVVVSEPTTEEEIEEKEDTSLVVLDFSSCYAESPYGDISAPNNFSDEVLKQVYKNGVITVYGKLNSVDKKKYIIRGMYNKQNKNVQTVFSTMRNLRIEIKAEDPIEIELDGISFSAPAGYPAISYTGSKFPEITMTVTGENRLQVISNSVWSSNAIDLTGKNLTIQGDGRLYVYASSGISGSNGTNYDVNKAAEHPSAGGIGYNGTKGGDAIVAKNLTIDMAETGEIICSAGSGGYGGRGGNGEGSYASGNATAPAGGNGGNGGIGGTAIYLSDTFTYKNAKSITLYSGRGGDGGAGGHGGNSYNGGIRDNGGAGGNGGNGGASGYCLSCVTTVGTIPADVLKFVPSRGGDGGTGGAGGNAAGYTSCGSGGKGGNGDLCRVAKGITSGTVDSSFTRGGNGGIGGSCGGAYSSYHKSTGLGGTGGGVECPNGISHSISAGTNGAKGSCGSNF